MKQILANARGTSPTHPLAVVIAGGLCGLVSWACVSHSAGSKTCSGSLTQSKIFPIDTAKSIYQRNCLVGGKDKQTRPKIQFLNPRMYRGTSCNLLPSLHTRLILCRSRCFNVSLLRGQRYFLYCIRVHKETHQSNGGRRRAAPAARRVCRQV